MTISKEQILAKIQEKDFDFFAQYGDNETQLEESGVSFPYRLNMGDGNEITEVCYFPEHDLHVMMIGFYSSWDSTQWDEIGIASPFTFTETRFKIKE